jgi:hypothetical protein
LNALLCEELDTSINNFWIEKPAFVADNLLCYFINAERRTIRLVGG